MAQERKSRGQGIVFLFNITLILSLTVCTPVRNVYKKARWLGRLENKGLPPRVTPGEQEGPRHLENYRFRDRPKNKVGTLSRRKRHIFYSWDMFGKREYKSYRYGYPQGANIFNIAPGHPGMIAGKNAWLYFAELAAEHTRDEHGLSRLWNDMLNVRRVFYLYQINTRVFNYENMVSNYLIFSSEFNIGLTEALSS